MWKPLSNPFLGFPSLWNPQSEIFMRAPIFGKKISLTPILFITSFLLSILLHSVFFYFSISFFLRLLSFNQGRRLLFDQHKPISISHWIASIFIFFLKSLRWLISYFFCKFLLRSDWCGSRGKLDSGSPLCEYKLLWFINTWFG